MFQLVTRFAIKIRDFKRLFFHERIIRTEELELGLESLFMVEVAKVEKIVWVSLLKVIRGRDCNIHSQYRCRSFSRHL